MKNEQLVFLLKVVFVDVFIFDLGENVSGRYICAKTPKLSNLSITESNKRFINELENQLKYYGHTFVHWPFEFTSILETPFALFRYWGSDLKKLIKENNASKVHKLSIMIYTAIGLRYCQKKGLISHQDLKPANIFLKNMTKTQVGLRNLDIHTHALIADFGLANAFQDSMIFDGSRPYMAPEQWNKSELTLTTDIFALGVIFFELMSGGYHPAIEEDKLHKFWPIPEDGLSKKWVGDKKWKQWVKNCEINFTNHQLPTHVINLIKDMISVNPISRPSIDSVIEQLLLALQNESNEAYQEVKFLINYYDNQSKNRDFKTSWPFLAKEWSEFKNKFTT